MIDPAIRHQKFIEILDLLEFHEMDRNMPHLQSLAAG
jgi:hypothetical protein